MRRLHEATPRTWVTVAVVAANVAVFLAMVASGVSPLDPGTQDLIRFGADYGPQTASGEWWRLLTSTFLHIGVIHIAFNMWALWQSGRLAERFYGNGAFLVLYLGSGIGASVVSLLWNPSIVSAGASGSIFGVFGGLLAVVLLHRKGIPALVFGSLKRSTIGVVAYNVVFGAAVPGIDNAAHIGGLVTGFALGFCLRRPLPSAAGAGEFDGRTGERSDLLRRTLRTLPVWILGVAGAAFAKLRIEGSPDVRSMQQFDLALQTFQEGNTDRALGEIEASLAIAPEDPRSLSLRGDIRWAMGDRDAAAADYMKAVRLAPEYPYPRKRLGWTHQDAGNLEAANSYFGDVIRLDPDDAEGYAARGWVRMQQGKPVEALADLDEALRHDAASELARGLRAYTLYDLQRWPEALAALREFQATGSQEFLIPEFYIWAIRARTGEAAAADDELRSRLGDLANDEDRKRIASFLLGDLPEADLLVWSLEHGAVGSNGQRTGLCEAWYFVGIKRLVEGNREPALFAFRRSAGTRAIDTPAWSSAMAEIAGSER